MNGKHTVNGLYSHSDASDYIYTDRGMHFSDGISAIRLPPNDQVQILDIISTTFTIIMWLNNFNNVGR